MSLQYQVSRPVASIIWARSIVCIYMCVCVDVNVRTKCLVDASITKMQVCVYYIILPGFLLEHLPGGEQNRTAKYFAGLTFCHL